jgi:hypothetical protein
MAPAAITQEEVEFAHTILHGPGGAQPNFFVLKPQRNRLLSLLASTCTDLEPGCFTGFRTRIRDGGANQLVIARVCDLKRIAAAEEIAEENSTMLWTMRAGL